MLNFTDTQATKKIFQLKKRIRAVTGGTSASKTISILVWLIDYAQTGEDELISVVSESYPHLAGGAMLDFENIMKAQGYWDEGRFIKNPRPTYTFKNRCKIEFISVDDYGKAHGPRRDVLFINECNNLDYKIVDQLITRTRKIVWLDWNPTEEFWFYTEMQPNRDDIDFITLTYKDNEALDPIMVKEIEGHQYDPAWWKVYGLGQMGTTEGNVYKDWLMIPEIPHEARLISYGLDFGYKHDPSVLVALYYHNGGYIVDEILYQKGLFNKQIADIILANPVAPVIADAAEPKSIDEMRLYGLTIIGSTKGKGAVSQRIAFVAQQRISYTRRSVNLKKSYKNYKYITDSSGKITNEPSHWWSDGMDAVGYALQIKASVEPTPIYVQPPYEPPGYAASPMVVETQEVFTGDFKPHRR